MAPAPPQDQLRSRSAPSLRSSSSKLAQLTLEQILEHLDNLRLNLTNTKQNCRYRRPAPLPCGASGHVQIPDGDWDAPGCQDPPAWLTKPSAPTWGAKNLPWGVDPAPDSPFSVSSTVFSQTPILQALQHVQASCDEAHKMK